MKPANAQTLAATPPLRAWMVALVFVPFAAGYFLSFLFRSINAVIAPQLVAEFGLGAGDLGLLTAAYFFAFAAFQLPLGLLLDRFGPRRVQSCLLLSAALGGAIFALSGARELLILGRALIGLGFSGGLMASFKAVTLWFPPRRWPLVNGCFLAMGGLGATMATKPVALMLTVSDWRTIIGGLAAITAGVALLIFLLVPREPPRQASLSLAHQLEGLRSIYADPYFWRLAPVAITTLAVGLAIQGLWAGPWLRDVAGFGPARVANYLFALNFAMMLGMIGSGVLTDLLGRLGLTVMQAMTGYLVIYLAAQAVLAWQLAPTGLLPWVTFGFMCNMAVLVYSQLAVYFPLHFAGTVHTGLNVLMMGGAFLVQYGIGAIIDLWPPTAQGGYAPAGYAVAFGVLLALEAASFLWFLLRRGAPHPR